MNVFFCQIDFTGEKISPAVFSPIHFMYSSVNCWILSPAMADQEPFTSSHGVITAASSSLFPYIARWWSKNGKNSAIFFRENDFTKNLHRLEQVQAKKLVKSNKSISQIIFLTKCHFLQFQKWPKINFWTWKTAKNAISRVFLPGLF